MNEHIKPDLSLEVSNQQALFELNARLEAIERRANHDAANAVMIKQLAREIEELQELIMRPHERLEALERELLELRNNMQIAGETMCGVIEKNETD